MKREEAIRAGRADSPIAALIRRRPATAFIVALAALEALARLAGGYSLLSLHLQPRSDGRGAVSVTVRHLNPLDGGAHDQSESDVAERRRLRLVRPDLAAPTQDDEAIDQTIFVLADAAPATGAPYRYPQNATLPGGHKTDGYGWIATASEPPEGEAIRIAFVGGDFIAGEPGISLPSLIRERIETARGRRGEGRQPAFSTYNLGREDLAPHDLASVIDSEAALIRPHLIVIDEMSTFAPANRYFEADQVDKPYVRRFNATFKASYFRNLYSPPRFSALLSALTPRLSELRTQAPFVFDSAIAAPPEAADKSRAVNAAIAAARNAGADVLILGPRAPIRAGQSYPRWRSGLRAMWYETQGPADGRRFSVIASKDESLARDRAGMSDAAYFSFAPMAGRLQFFDDDLTLSAAGYERAATDIAERILDLAEEKKWRPTPMPDLSALAAPIAAREARWSCASAAAPIALTSAPAWRAGGPKVVAGPDGATFELDTKKRMTFIAAAPLAPILADLRTSVDRRIVVRGELLRGRIAIRTARNAGQRHFGAAPVIAAPGPFSVEIAIEEAGAERAEIYITNESKKGSAVRLEPPAAMAAPCTLEFEDR